MNTLADIKSACPRFFRLYTEAFEPVQEGPGGIYFVSGRHSYAVHRFLPDSKEIVTVILGFPTISEAHTAAEELAQ